MNSITRTIRAVSVTAAVAISLTSFAAHAVEATAEQRRACTPDAFRLCSAHIPNVEAITACMRAKKSELSPACKLVFDKAPSTKVAKQDQ